MERETGFEPATPSLEGWRSTAELFPRNPERPPFPSTARVEATPFRSTGPVGATPFSNRPPALLAVLKPIDTMVGRGGFEPPKAYASRFTVCPLWPLGYLPEPAGMRWKPLG